MSACSRYTLTLSLEQGLYLAINSISGAKDIINGALLDIIRSGRFERLGTKLSHHLISRGYISEASQPEQELFFKRYAQHLHEIRANEAINTFWVIPTYGCNLRCAYCFQAHSLHEQTSEGSMNVASVEPLFAALKSMGGSRASEAYPGRYITLFGGEPLQRENRPFVEALVAQAQRDGYRLGAITNGIDLDHYFDLIGPQSIRWLQVTIDGPPGAHSSRRVDRLNRQQEVLLEYLRRIAGLGIKLAIRTNVDSESLALVAETETLLKEEGLLGRKNVYWHIVPIETHASKYKRFAPVLPSQIQSELRAQNIRSGRDPVATQIRRNLRALASRPMEEIAAPSSCGAHSGMYFFDPYGLIYACAEQCGQPSKAIGRYADGHVEFHDGAREHWLGRHVGSVSECSKCAYALFCGGGCANAACAAGQTIYAARCFGFQKSFDDEATAHGRENVSAADLQQSSSEHPYCRPLNAITLPRFPLATIGNL